jgi:hypothetical protein
MLRGNLIRNVLRAFCHGKRLFLFHARRAGIEHVSLSLRMLKRLPVEALIWLSGLLVLAFPDTSSNHFSLCPLNNAGLDFCPGCGLGKSINLLFRGELSKSFDSHPLGIFAVIVLSFRIVNLTKQYLQNYGKSY